MRNDLTSALASAVTGAVIDAIDGPTPLRSTMPQVAAAQVTEKVIAAAASDPIVQHLTNSEPWYRSRVTWGAIVSIAVPALGAFGVAVDAVDADTAVSVAVALGSAVGGVLTLIGRYKARRPIGA